MIKHYESVVGLHTFYCQNIFYQKVSLLLLSSIMYISIGYLSVSKYCFGIFKKINTNLKTYLTFVYNITPERNILLNLLCILGI